MAYDYRKLCGKIVEKFGTNYRFAEALGLSERSLSLKLTNKVGWKQKEISKACTLLGIPDNEVHDYFFTLLVQ